MKVLIISILGYSWENDEVDLIDQKDENKIVSMDIQDTPTADRNGSVPLENDDEVIDSTFDSRVHLELNDDTGDLFLLILKKTRFIHFWSIANRGHTKPICFNLVVYLYCFE